MKDMQAARYQRTATKTAEWIVSLCKWRRNSTKSTGKLLKLGEADGTRPRPKHLIVEADKLAKRLDETSARVAIGKF